MKSERKSGLPFDAAPWLGRTSETPITDAECEWGDGDTKRDVSADFARSLEREINKYIHLCYQFAEAVRENPCGHKPFAESGKCEACEALKQWDALIVASRPNTKLNGSGENQST